MQSRRTGLKAALAFTYITVLALPIFAAAPAAAVVYCKTVGVPKGCVVRPPVAATIYCTAPGRPVGCVARPGVGVVGVPGVGVPGVGAPGVGAPGVGVARTPANRGGPVNRVGVR
ncbi:hypothetical protein [Rhizobium sp. FY34]|uniref:hypothetical protein n=1 Tax=Rhizobium sp. FY34 TaxID=2562309 RepID=UPI001FF00637|nr:hypothetical protein [Rhizobium sp. FY34]